MTGTFSASMALAPLSARRVPERSVRSPNRRHPPSTTPLSGPDAALPERVVPHPVEPALEMPAAGLHVLVPVPGRREIPDGLRRPARPDVRLASANRRARSAPGRQDRLAASEARSGQWRRPGTMAAFRPPKSPSQALGIQSAPSETTTGPPASCSPRRRASRSGRAAKSEASRPPDGAAAPPVRQVTDSPPRP